MSNERQVTLPRETVQKLQRVSKLLFGEQRDIVDVVDTLAEDALESTEAEQAQIEAKRESMRAAILGEEDASRSEDDEAAGKTTELREKVRKRLNL